MTVNLASFEGAHTPHLAQLLSACTGLCELDLANFDPKLGFSQRHRPPNYRLSTLTFNQSLVINQQSDYEWVFGDSKDTLETFSMTDYVFPLLSNPRHLFATATPQLRAIHYHLAITQWTGERVLKLLKLTKHPTLALVELKLGDGIREMAKSEWAAVEDMVARSTARLDDQSRAKLSVKLITPRLIEEVESDDSDDEVDR